ncbi:MAG: hypothetical protein ACPGD8_06970, partial [Flavobacteriales bacterium]
KHLAAKIIHGKYTMTYRKRTEEEETPEWFPDAERDRRRQAEAQLAQQKQKELEAQQHDSPKINIRYVFKREKSETDGNKKGEQ